MKAKLLKIKSDIWNKMLITIYKILFGNQMLNDLGFAKNLQIFGIEKITTSLFILLANVLPILIAVICSILRSDQIL